MELYLANDFYWLSDYFIGSLTVLFVQLQFLLSSNSISNPNMVQYYEESVTELWKV